jgi:serine/threonine protein kinase
MDAKRYARLEELFGRARALAAEVRQEFLEEVDGEDPDLGAELRALLAEDERTSDAFGESRLGGSVGTLASELSSLAQPVGALPDKIGDYSILGVLGRGGMGTVYRARQSAPDREVALKVMHPTLSDRALWRFEYEGRLLARLQHPSIAQVHEVGRNAGEYGTQPYIVMELVVGEDIGAYARSRGLSDEERLELLAKVCDGVHFAHQQRVIHRDLKPGNVLVGEDGRPRILDFGVARGAPEEDSRVTEQRTQAGEIVGTLAYMAPEQASGDPDAVGIEADIYALGVMGYELLSGKLPLDLDTRHLGPALKRLQEADPPTLSGIHPRWRGDVSTIFRKALEKEPQRRYPSAEALGSDLRRYLAREPILARPSTGWYRFNRFARRNKLLVGSLTTVLLVLLASFAVVARYSIIAARERNLAEERLVEADAIATFHEQMLASSRNLRGGAEVTVADVLDTTAAELDEQFPEPSLAKARILHTIGATYRHISRLDQAETYLVKAFEMREELLGPAHPDTLASESELGSYYWMSNQREPAERHLVNVYEQALASDGRRSPDTVARAINLAVFLDDDPAHYDRAEAIYREQLDNLDGSEEGLASYNGVSILNNLSVLLRRQGRLAEALEFMQQGNDISIETFGLNDEKTIINLVNLGGTYIGMRRYEDALQVLQRAYQPTLDVHGKEHVGYGMLLYRLAETNSGLGRNDEAEPLFVEALERLGKVFGVGHYRTLTMRSSYAQFLVGNLRSEEGIEVLDEILEQWPESDDPDPLNEARYLQLKSSALFNLERWDEALIPAERAHAIYSEVHGESDPATLHARELIDKIEAELGG